jgi:hypothetical protein
VAIVFFNDRWYDDEHGNLLKPPGLFLRFIDIQLDKKSELKVPVLTLSVSKFFEF